MSKKKTMINDETISLFSFTAKEKKIWAFLSDYIDRIEEWKQTNSFNNDQIIRFGLIGLFVDYRASNHRGVSFDTYIKTDLKKSKMIKFQTINSLLGKEITSTKEYLTMIKLNNINNITGKSLYDFVIKGCAI